MSPRNDHRSRRAAARSAPGAWAAVRPDGGVPPGPHDQAEGIRAQGGVPPDRPAPTVRHRQQHDHIPRRVYQRD